MNEEAVLCWTLLGIAGMILTFASICCCFYDGLHRKRQSRRRTSPQAAESWTRFSGNHGNCDGYHTDNDGYLGFRDAAAQHASAHLDSKPPTYEASWAKSQIYVISLNEITPPSYEALHKQ